MDDLLVCVVFDAVEIGLGAQIEGAAGNGRRGHEPIGQLIGGQRLKHARGWKGLKDDPQHKDNVSGVIHIFLKRTAASQI
jgi:hypothetical protein